MRIRWTKWLLAKIPIRVCPFSGVQIEQKKTRPRGVITWTGWVLAVRGCYQAVASSAAGSGAGTGAGVSAGDSEAGCPALNCGWLSASRRWSHSA